jgi:VWFA-related protein
MKNTLPAIALGLSLCTLFPAQPPEKKRQEPRFRAEAYAGLLEVRVTDQEGRPVPNLKQEDFQVREDGRPRKIVFFGREDSVPLSLGILIDTGSTMSDDYVSSARDMVFELVHLLDPDDEILLGGYDEDVHFVTGLTSDRKELVDGLWNIAARRRQKSFLRDLFKGPDSRTGRAVDFTLLELKRARHGTKVILVLSAGFGAIGLGTLDHLEIAGARFFGISFPNKAGDVLGLGGDQMARKRVVEETGGISYSPQEVIGKLQVVRDALKKVYLLAYETGSGKQRAEISVVNHPEYRVHFAPRVSSTDSFY